MSQVNARGEAGKVAMGEVLVVVEDGDFWFHFISIQSIWSSMNRRGCIYGMG